MEKYLLIFLLSLSLPLFAGEIDSLATKYEKDPSSIPKNIKAVDKILRIGFERTSCDGSCRSYYLSITSGGEVKYEGYEGVKLKGKHHGTILYDADLERTIEYLASIKFLEMPFEFGSICLDCASTYLMAESSNGIKLVALNDDNVVPLEAWVASQLIEHLLTEVRWEKK